MSPLYSWSCMFFYLYIVSKPESVNFHPVNGTAVRVSWNGSSIFSTWLHFISCYNATGAVLSQYNTLIPPGEASNIVTVEDDLTLTDSKEEIKHSFSLRFNITELHSMDQRPLQHSCSVCINLHYIFCSCLLCR